MYRIAHGAVSLVLLSAATINLPFINHKPVGQLTTTAAVATTASRKTVVKPASKPATPPPVMVTVQPEDTLTSIADTHETTYIRIYEANEVISNPDVVQPGQQVRIPRNDETLPERPLPDASTVTTSSVPAATPVAYNAPKAASVAAVTTISASVPVIGNDAKAFIYAHESGNNPNATNPNGCYGLGQDCNGVVRGQCGADYACQDAFFTDYAMRRYGSWEGALSFWQANGWW